MPSSLRPLVRFVLDSWPWFALFTSAFMLAAAHAYQAFGGLAPCILCLKQREVYWVAGTVALVAVVAGFTPYGRVAGLVLCAALALIFLVGTGVAVYHAGAEYKFWPGPAACAAGGSASVGDIEAMLSGVQRKVVSCEDPTWMIPGIITMAGLNALISLKLAAWSIAAAVARRRP